LVVGSTFLLAHLLSKSLIQVNSGTPTC